MANTNIYNAVTYALGIILSHYNNFFPGIRFFWKTADICRVAVISDKVIQTPRPERKGSAAMILGLGCGTMAAMSTRILETTGKESFRHFSIAWQYHVQPSSALSSACWVLCRSGRRCGVREHHFSSHLHRVLRQGCPRGKNPIFLSSLLRSEFPHWGILS